MDRLESLLLRFSVTARMFHSGPLCGINDFAPEPGLGQLHLVRSGGVRARHQGGLADVELTGPGLLFYPRPCAHRFETDPARGADMACAHVRFNAGSANPLADALPALVALPLHVLDGSATVLEVLFDEAFGARCGRQAVVDRLFEVVLIAILRQQLVAERVDRGLFAGLAHPALARALVALHAEPAHDWTLTSLAARAGMSRSAFASAFRECVGRTPGEYLARWRITLAQQALRDGRALKQVAHEVGYASEAALSRAFKALCGASPRAWKAAAARPAAA